MRVRAGLEAATGDGDPGPFPGLHMKHEQWNFWYLLPMFQLGQAKPMMGSPANMVELLARLLIQLILLLDPVAFLKNTNQR